MDLKQTYAQPSIHERWESVYRANPHLDRLNDAIMDRIVACTRPRAGAVFLDAGCGIGDHSRRIAARGYACVGVDISRHILQVARRLTAARGAADRVRFVCQALELEALRGETFDVIHCRGVLMHIPDWRSALVNLCRLLRPGGHLVVLESNHRSLFARAYVAARAVAGRAARSQMVRTDGGVEFWSVENGAPFVVRLADMGALGREFAANDVREVARFSTSLVDIERVPAGWPRTAAVRLNHAAFALGLPPRMCKGNVLIGRKDG